MQTKRNMKKLSLLLFTLIYTTLNISFLIGKVDVTNLVEYQIHHTNYEGYSGPGFFIMTEDLKEVSNSMKNQLGIQDKHHFTKHNSTKISFIATSNPETMQRNKEQNNGFQSFQDKANEVRKEKPKLKNENNFISFNF